MDFEEFVDYDKRYERPAEVDLLIGDPAKAKKQLDWEPKTDFKGLVKLRVEADLQLAKKELAVKQASAS
jgi:GDPmannose 4,6-dehydratase